MRPWLLAGLIIALSAVLGFATLTGDHDWGDDFSAYIIQAISIVHGTERAAVAHMAYSVEHSTNLPVPTAAPWGFPALLAPWTVACGGVHPLCLKTINLPFFALFLLAFFVFLRSRLPDIDAAILLSIFAFSPVLLAFEDNVLSDIAFLCFSMCSIAAIDKVFLERKRFNGSPGGNVLVGVAIFAAFFVRTNGILLLPAAFVAQASVYHGRRAPGERPQAIALLPYAVFAVLAAVVLITLPGGEGGSLAALKGTSIETIWQHVAAYTVLPSVFFWTLPLYELLYGALMPFFIAGLLLRAKREAHVVTYAGLTILLFVLWPFDQGLRYIFALLPFFIYFTYCGMQAAGIAIGQHTRALDRRVARVAWLAIAVAFAAASAGAARTNLAANRVATPNGPFSPSSASMFAAVTSLTSPRDVVIFDRPRAMFLLTGRDAILIDQCAQLDRGTVVVLRKNGGTSGQVAPQAAASCNPRVSLTTIFENADYIAYRLAPAGAATRGQPT